MIFSIVKNRIKIALRRKELYIYVIGFPLMFMIIYGSIAPLTYSSVETINIGFITSDVGTSYVIGDNISYKNYSEAFYQYLDDLYYESKPIKVFSIRNFSDINSAEKVAERLDVAGVIYLPENFSASVYNSTTILTYSSLMPLITRYINEAYREGDYDLANRYLNALEELSEFANNTFSVSIIVIGDPTYSKAMQLYEIIWKHVANFIFKEAREFSRKYISYLENKYNVSIKLNKNTFNVDISNSFNIRFKRIGSVSAKESYLEMYYSILVPGQIIQSVMIASVSAIYMIGYEISTGILQRLKLTKMSSAEYIGGTLISWGIISLILGSFLLSIAIALNYITLAWTIEGIILSVIILILAGIITASYSFIFLSFTDEKIAGTTSLISLLMISLLIADYFPVPNPVIASFMNLRVTLFDLVPWRTAIISLRKVLILSSIYRPMDIIPELVLLVAWTLIYSITSFIVFDKFRLRKLN